MGRFGAGAGVLVAVALGPSAAWADALPPPPACPPGSRGASSHAGQHCVAAPCESDQACQDVGSACRSWRVCTRSTEVRHHRRAHDLPPRREEVVVGSCAPTASCQGDEEPAPPTVGELAPGRPSCVTGRFCVPASLPPLPTAAPGRDPERSGPGAPATGSDGSGLGARSRPGACGCRLDSRQGAGGAGWLAALGLLALARRRRS